jgi:hypothetical protein
MSKLIVRLFYDPDDAAAAVDEVKALGVGPRSIRVIGEKLAADTVLPTLSGAGVVEDEARSFAEAVRRGATLVTVRPEPGQAPAAEQALNGHNAQTANGYADPARNIGLGPGGE